ncbi:MAG: redox-sensing transcriptional repressor Rex [Eubacteriaceae bacterium]|uniref:Redox-sensing transcriptional repressor Rex n=2 Tax=Pseudoramibacter TaxID=113286 RepID=A0A6L5GSY1_9FIRM|nr:redox-sensing transcriptional repressor Rex [Candidatus Pseudoramibacter fermentans]RRF93696.1 MAG: redox-sensing transcriptional repressor Rex [Eubacteriaceae bacterium]
MRKNSKKVSMSVIRRLPKYYRFLTDLNERGFQKISSMELSKMMGLTASQIRQDLNSFGAYGQQGYGYRVQELKDVIHDLLGLNRPYRCVIIGAGNLGHAISHYEGFRNEGIWIRAMFDIDSEKVGQTHDGVPIFHMDYLDEYVKENMINIAILCVPRAIGQSVANQVVRTGIKGIMNFVPIDLTLPDDVMIEDVNISDSLYTLTYMLSRKQ